VVQVDDVLGVDEVDLLQDPYFEIKVDDVVGVDVVGLF
jgi:hypothetical protein